MSITIAARDATGQNAANIPIGVQAECYVTGQGVAWTSEQIAEHDKPYPAVWIVQDPDLSVSTADVADIEFEAGLISQVAGWAARAKVDYYKATRPGQRKPACYCDQENVTPIVNALIAGGITSGVGLLVANWNDTATEAIAAVSAGSGPFPIIGVQFRGGTSTEPWDLDILSVDWLTTVSTPAPPPHVGPWRHLTADQSLDEIAKIRGTAVEHLFRVSAGAYTLEDIDLLAAIKTTGVPWYSTEQ
jgi:hypothetical protein